MAELTTFGAMEKTLEQPEVTQQPIIETASIEPSISLNDPAATPAPIVETKVEDVTPENTEVAESTFSLAVDGVVKVEEPKPVAEQKPFNLDEEIKKIDRKELLKKAGVTDFAIEIDDFLLKGGKAEDYLNAKAIDYNKVSDEAIIKADLAKQYPTFSTEQINLMFGRKYSVDELSSDEDKEFASLQLKADAHNSRQQKITEQQKFKIPDTPILQKDEAYEQWKQQQESQPQLMEQFRNYYEQHEATKSLNESKKVAISLGDGVPPFNFTLDQPQVLTQALTDGGVIINKLMTTQSGEPDVAKQQLVTLFSFNPQKFIQDIFKYGQSMGVRKELVEGGQNAQRPQAKVTDMNSNAAPTVSLGKFGDRSR